MKTEQMTIVYAQWDRWTSYDVIKHHMITTDVTLKKLQKLFSNKLTSCNLKIGFKSPIRVKTFFTFKDKLPKMLLSGLVYQYKCGGCNATYYGKTKHHFKV